ncbi:MAG: hypothetical protein QM278_02710 [Pseudomonadota bacterium]|nr:hypothetical protein [Pseudomonadota bacterium]
MSGQEVGYNPFEPGGWQAQRPVALTISPKLISFRNKGKRLGRPPIANYAYNQAVKMRAAETPRGSGCVSIPQREGQHLSCESAGVFLFAPFLEGFDIPELVRDAGRPGNKVIPAVGYFLSFCHSWRSGASSIDAP